MTATEPQSVITHRQAEVRAVSRPTPRTVRVTFGGDDLAAMPVVAPDGYLKLVLPPPGRRGAAAPAPPADGELGAWYRRYLALPDGIRPPMRTYTVRERRTEPVSGAVEMDVDFVLHARGPACEWVLGARPGSRIAFTGPWGLYAPRPEHDRVLLVGDETAVPAMSAIVEAGGDRPVTAVAEVHDDREHRDWAARGVAATWLSTPAGRPSRLLDVLRHLGSTGDRPYVWLVGEATLVKALRRHVVGDRGVPRTDVCFTGYWRRGVTEDQAAPRRWRPSTAARIPRTPSATRLTRERRVRASRATRCAVRGWSTRALLRPRTARSVARSGRTRRSWGRDGQPSILRSTYGRMPPLR